MSLKDWLDNAWLKSHKTDKAEIANLLALAEHDLADAKTQGLSPDWKFGIAYNAALKLCTIALYTQGYRPENALAHFRTIAALKEISPRHWDRHANYLNACRMKRNTLEYERTDTITTDEAIQLIDFTSSFLAEIKKYLELQFPQYLQ